MPRLFVHLSSVQFSSVAQLCLTPWTAALQALLSITNSQSLLKLMCIKSVMPSNLCCPLLILPSVFPSIRIFSNESALCIRWPKSIGVSGPASVLPVNIQDWFPLGSIGLISLQSKELSKFSPNHSSKVSIFRCSAFFIVQLSHPYMTTRKTIASTRWTFVGKVMSLLINMLSRLVIAFPPRSKCLFISWLPSPSAVILELKKINSFTVSIVSAST